MSLALIDNATLTAVQRLVGAIESRSRDSTDGDIAALENLVEAILFYDEIACLDSYKEEFRESRKQAFPFVRFLDLDNRFLDDVEQTATREAERARPQIRRGEFADPDFREFLDILKMHIICTWDLSSSVYYLTMKMLGQPDSSEFEKYGQLSASIFSELTDSKQTDGLNPFRENYSLLDAKGQPITKGYIINGAKHGHGETGGLTPALRVFIAALNWLSFKTIYYTLATRALKGDAFLYPIRQAFQIHWMRRAGAYDANFASALIRALRERSAQELEAVISVGRPQAISFLLPFFSAWLVTEVGDVRGVVDAALSLRSDPQFERVRQQISDLRVLHDSGDTAEVNARVQSISKDMESTFTNLRKQFSTGKGQTVQVRPLIQVFNSAASLSGLPKIPDLPMSIPLPSFIARDRSGFGSLYSDIVQDLAAIPRLGAARDLLGAAIRIEKNAAVYSPKAEDPSYRGSHSSWKSPM